MRHHIVVVALVAPGLVGAPAAALAQDLSTTTQAATVSRPSPGPWLVRAESSLVGMRDNWLSLPALEVGVTVGRDLSRRLSLELTGNVREVDSDQRRSWSALAAVRWVVASSHNGRHALTLAGGPFLEIDNVVHGTLPFAHGEVAYVYRAPSGLTVLAGAGPNVALASSSYVTPPSGCGQGDGDSFCIDLGPDAQEIHAGDLTLHVRLGVGWQF